MAHDKNVPFIKAINYLLYISSVFGLVCYSFTEYYRKKVLVNTVIGNVWAICSLILFVGVYHHIMAAIYFDGKFDSGRFSRHFNRFS